MAKGYGGDKMARVEYMCAVSVSSEPVHVSFTVLTDRVEALRLPHNPDPFNRVLVLICTFSLLYLRIISATAKVSRAH